MKKRFLAFLAMMGVSLSLLAGCGSDRKTVEAADGTEAAAEPRQSYFEEHGEKVSDAPVACMVNGLIYNPDNPEEYQMTTDATWEQLDCYSEPADEEGYQSVHLELCAAIQNYYDAAQDIDYNRSRCTSRIYDWYTGCMFPVHDMKDTDSAECTATLEINGVSYEISYTKEQQWEFEPWVYDDSGNCTSDGKCYISYLFKVPDGYDGLVFAAVPKNQYTELDAEIAGKTDEKGNMYALEEEHYTEGTKFFRINKG